MLATGFSAEALSAATTAVQAQGALGFIDYYIDYYNLHRELGTVETPLVGNGRSREPVCSRARDHGERA